MTAENLAFLKVGNSAGYWAVSMVCSSDIWMVDKMVQTTAVMMVLMMAV